MRTLMVILTCVLCALPLTAQATRTYQPPSKAELTELRKDSAPDLREVRGGASTTRARLSAAEFQQLEELAKDHPEAQQLLRDLRAGRVHVHADGWWDDWAWAIILSGSCTGALLLLLLILLLIW